MTIMKQSGAPCVMSYPVVSIMRPVIWNDARSAGKGSSHVVVLLIIEVCSV